MKQEQQPASQLPVAFGWVQLLSLKPIGSPCNAAKLSSIFGCHVDRTGKFEF